MGDMLSPGPWPQTEHPWPAHLARQPLSLRPTRVKWSRPHAALGCVPLCPTVRMGTLVSRKTLTSRAFWAQCCPAASLGLGQPFCITRYAFTKNGQIVKAQGRPGPSLHPGQSQRQGARPATQQGQALWCSDAVGGKRCLCSQKTFLGSEVGRSARRPARGWGGQRSGQHREGCPCSGECQVNLWACTSSGRGRRKAALVEPHAPALQNPAPDSGTRPKRGAPAATWPLPKSPSCRFISKYTNTQTQRATGN